MRKLPRTSVWLPLTYCFGQSKMLHSTLVLTQPFTPRSARPPLYPLLPFCPSCSSAPPLPLPLCFPVTLHLKSLWTCVCGCVRTSLEVLQLPPRQSHASQFKLALPQFIRQGVSQTYPRDPSPTSPPFPLFSNWQE